MKRSATQLEWDRATLKERSDCGTVWDRTGFRAILSLDDTCETSSDSTQRKTALSSTWFSSRHARPEGSRRHAHSKSRLLSVWSIHVPKISGIRLRGSPRPPSVHVMAQRQMTKQVDMSSMKINRSNVASSGLGRSGILDLLKDFGEDGTKDAQLRVRTVDADLGHPM